MEEANRLKRLPPYLFTIIDNLKKEVAATGMDIIDLAMGNPDLAPAQHIIDELTKSCSVEGNHRYSKADGPIERQLNIAISNWYKDKFNVDLDPKTEVLPLIGSKEGVAHLSTGFLNPDDIALIPSPAYPVHFNGVIMAGGILFNLPLYKENNYLPDLEDIQSDVLRRSKLFLFSYPHNPTGAVANPDFYEKSVEFASDDLLILYSDGVTEAQNEDGEFFGEEALTRELSNIRELNSKQIGEKLIAVVDNFVGKAKVHDDLTIAILKRTP